MKILLRLWDATNKMGFAEGRAEGGAVKELLPKGLIKPAGKVGRRIRWVLVEGKLTERDIVSMRKLVTTDYRDYEIMEWSDGFKLVPGSLNIVASFIVKKGNFAAGFAFRVGYLDWVAKKLKKQMLLQKAKSIIDEYIDQNKVENLDEFTFEFDSTDFVRVDNPKWWIKSS